MFKTLFVTLCLMGIVGIGMVFYWGRLPREQNHGQGRSIPVSYDAPREFRYPSPVRLNLTPAESNAVQAACLRITEAYTNGMLNELRQRLDEIPAVITNSHYHFYLTLVRPLSTALDSRFLMTDQLRDFTDRTDFERSVESSLLVVKFLGNMAILRGEFPGCLSVYDGNTLRNLRRYREKFHKEGREDLVHAADRFLAEWIGQIESEFGFTRWLLWHQLDLQWPLFEEGKMTRTQLTDCIRNWSFGLDRTGYKPKWLDEFIDGPNFKWKYVTPAH